MLRGKKTYITAAVAIMTAVGAYLAGDMDAAATAQAVLTAVLAATLRHGMI
jgi:hypothetical protein